MGLWWTVLAGLVHAARGNRPLPSEALALKRNYLMCCTSQSGLSAPAPRRVDETLPNKYTADNQADDDEHYT